MSFRKKLFIAGISCLLIFTFFSYQVQHGGYKKLDFDTTVRIQDMILKSGKLRMIEFVDTLAESCVFLVSPELSIVWVLVLTGIAGYDRKQKKIRWQASLIPLLFGLLILAELYGKSVVHHPAPPFFMMRNPTMIFPTYYINEQFSYPSGHAARVVFFTIISLFVIPYSSFLPARLDSAKWVGRHGLIHFFKRRRRMVLLSLGIVLCMGVGLSKLYLGHHWLSDIVGGGIIGAGCALFAIGIWKQ